MNKTLLVVGLLVAATAAGMIAYHFAHKTNGGDDIPIISKDDMSTPEYDSWVHWQSKNGKKYSSKEVDYRMSVYHHNYNKIMSQPQDASYTLEINQFMDLTESEFAKYYLGYRAQNKKMNLNRKFAQLDVVSTPSSVDWRTSTNPKIVTDVKNQQQCGSCWAFSTTGSVEGLYAQTQGSSKSFSEQQLVDCSGSYGNQGCNGGLMDDAFQYVEVKGLETESQYPYEAVDGTCNYQSTGDFKIGGYHDVTVGDAAAMRAAIAIRPVSVAVDAQAWSFYGGGIFSNCGTSLDHGVLAVGYNYDAEDNSKSYWIVKNSWGASWGESGYIRLAMGNTCGILNSASYPTA